MFDNISNKLKGLAKFIAWASIICGGLVVIIGFFMFVSNADYIEYATAYGGSSYYSILEESGNTAYSGLQMLKYGLIYGVVGLLSSWPIYGFGELIENTKKLCDIKEILKASQKNSTENSKQTKEITSPKTVVKEGRIVCNMCGEEQSDTRQSCYKCGAKFI